MLSGDKRAFLKIAVRKIEHKYKSILKNNMKLILKDLCGIPVNDR